MATNEAKTGPDTDALFTQLAEPFGPSEIKWRVTHTSHDGTRGAVIAFADPRAYTDRLNQLFTPSGWTRNYDVTTVSAVSRQKRDKIIQTGKVLVTCTLTIARLGTHSGSGEQWADEQNAMTAAEAQAFKRAAAVLAWAVIFTTCRRPGSISMGRVSRPGFPHFPTGRFRRLIRRPERPTRPAVHGLRKCNVGPSIRESRARSKAFGAFSAIQFTARYCGVSRERRRRTPSPTHSCRRMSRRRWNGPRGESARRSRWPSRSEIRNSSPCSIACTSGQ